MDIKEKRKMLKHFFAIVPKDTFTIYFSTEDLDNIPDEQIETIFSFMFMQIDLCTLIKIFYKTYDIIEEQKQELDKALDDTNRLVWEILKIRLNESYD